jgi:hypothetical protein
VFDNFREISDQQYRDFYQLLNEAIRNMGGSRVFTDDDEGIAASYLRILLVLIGHWSRQSNAFSVAPDDTSLSEPLFRMEDLYEILADKYKRETVRRYIGDLTRFKLIVRDGRGDSGWIRISMQAVHAIACAVKQWVAQMLTIEEQLRALGAYPNDKPARRSARA